MKHLTTLLQQVIKSELWDRWMPFRFYDIGKRKCIFENTDKKMEILGFLSQF